MPSRVWPRSKARRCLPLRNGGGSWTSCGTESTPPTWRLENDPAAPGRMTIDAFIDTNVLLYAVSNSAKEIEKKWLARGLLEKKNFGLSVQVLQEFYVNATWKLAKTQPEA